MFDIGWSELLLVAVLAIIFVGPKDLPRLMRTLGQYTAKMRAMAREFQNSFEDLARETELDELRKQVADLRDGAMLPLAEMQRSVEVPASTTTAREEPQSDEAGATPKLTVESPAPVDASVQDKKAGPV
ncbi:MAG TPA: Sec-independent protein translocase protein TatB [Parvibaculum sp.]|jgi:sec-independent protein translocase protein TatB